MNLKEVIWLGDSREAISEFPEAVRIDLGFQVYRMQQSKLPTKSRPMKSIGKSVFELKEQDAKGWYRVIYTLEIKNRIYVLHCFKKQSAKTEKRDLELAKSRLKEILRRI